MSPPTRADESLAQAPPGRPDDPPHAPTGRAVSADDGRTPTPGTPERVQQPSAPARRDRYVPVMAKYVLAMLGTVLWVGLAIVLSQRWLAELRPVVGPVGAVVIVLLVAYLPGGIVAFLTFSLLMDRQPPPRVTDPTTAVTVIIAARNEEEGVVPTIEALARVRYAGRMVVVLANNGSTDRTVERAGQTAERVGLDLEVVHEPRPGKAHALNAALATVGTDLVVTVDADTLLHRDAMRRLVARLESAPPDTVAVAGAVLVRNSRENFLARMQEWDYYLGIAGVKRMQGLYQSTLVAQGAFSVYRTDALRAIGGWPDAIGEDIVVTWRLMEAGRRVFFEPTAVAFTDVPVQVRHFFRQRARWARGMLEGLRAVPPWRQERGLSKLIASIDLLIPFLDIGYVLIWLPGIVLFLLGYPLVVSMWTLFVLPITLLVYGALRRYQVRNVFGPLGLRVRRNRLGYLGFLLLYQVLCSTASLVGYTQFLTGRRRRWK